MALSDDITNLPASPASGASSHLTNHAVIHAALKAHEARANAADTNLTKKADLIGGRVDPAQLIGTGTTGTGIRVDTTVGTRVFVGTTMVYGDTGDRDLAGVLPEGWTATVFRLRRVGQLVTMAIVDLKPDVPSGTASLDGVIPAGFRPTPRHMFNVVGADYAQMNTAGGISFVSTDGSNIHGVIAFHTHQSWPSSLPGVPGPGPSV